MIVLGYYLVELADVLVCPVRLVHGVASVNDQHQPHGDPGHGLLPRHPVLGRRRLDGLQFPNDIHLVGRR